MTHENSYHESKCSWCGDMKDNFNFVDCDGCERADLCENCYDQTTNGNYCEYCTGEYEPQIPRHPDAP